MITAAPGLANRSVSAATLTPDGNQPCYDEAVLRTPWQTLLLPSPATAFTSIAVSVFAHVEQVPGDPILGNQLAALPYPGVRDVRINPALVRESAIADLSGLELAWQTWQGIEAEAGKLEAQAFFTAWARLWPQAVSPASQV